MKRQVSELMKSCEMAQEDIAMDGTCEREEPVNRAGSSTRSPNECHFPPSQDFEVSSILKPNKLSGGSSQESVSKSGSENETSTTRQCNKSNKKLKVVNGPSSHFGHFSRKVQILTMVVL